jgi:hypothetical protein
MVSKKELFGRIKTLEEKLNSLSNEIATNGVVNDIVELKKQVFPVKSNSLTATKCIWDFWWDNTKPVVLSDKVDALIDYLGVNITTQKESEKVVVNKIKVPKKTKKGKK